MAYSDAPERVTSPSFADHGLFSYSDPEPSSPNFNNLEPPGPKPRNNILGLRPVLFWIIIALLVIIFAGALGGGIGGGLAAKSHNSR